MSRSASVGSVLAFVLAASTALAEHVTIDYTFERPQIQAIRVAGESYDRVILPGAPKDGPAGAPRLPARGASILLPYGQELVGVEVFAGERVFLGSGYHIEPVGKAVPISAISDEPEAPQPDAAIYASNQPYPVERFVNVGVQRFRGYPLVILRLEPTEYVPARGELYYYPRLRVVVETRAASRGEALWRGLEKDRDEVVRRVDNPEAAWSYPAAARDGRGYELLIITTPELAASFVPLKAYHDSHGLPAEIRTTSEIGGSDPDLLRAYIANEYSTNGIEYVLIGGDDDLLPAKDLYVDSLAGLVVEDMPSDFYYGCLDGTFNYDGNDRWGEPTDGEGGADVDLVAEVYVGRAAVDNAAEVARFVTKTLWYLDRQHQYPSKVLLVGEDLGGIGVSMYASPYLEELVDGSDAHGYTTVGFPSEILSVDRLYDDPEYSWPNSELIARINNGVHIVNHLGHGSIQWAMKISNNDISQFTNANLCFLYSQTCLAGHFDGPKECWAETAHVKTDYGAFAIIMNAREGWGVYGSTDGPSHRYNREFWNAIYRSDEYYPELGRANAHSKEKNIWRIDSPCMRWCFYELTLFGDPTLRLASCRDDGLLTLDRGHYACEDVVHLRLADCGLNLDNGAIETVAIHVASDTQPSGETVVLSETFHDSAVFEGELRIGPAGVPGLLRVNEGDVLTATYIDADDSQGGTDVPVTATANVDCTPPVLSNVHVTDVGPHSAVVAFTADEPVFGTVRYGPECTTQFFIASSSGYSTPVQIPLTGFSEDTSWFFTLEARDEAGNLAIDPLCHGFNTTPVPDYLTEQFLTDNDLDYTSLVFVPNNSVSFYYRCSEPISNLPTDPAGSTNLTFTNNDDGYAQISLSGGATVRLFGESYSTFYVGTNGYITFVTPDTNPLESLVAHFNQPRISGLFHDLVAGAGGSVKWKQLSDRVAVTYNNIREFGSTNRSTFQIEMYFDGRIVLSYLSIGVADGLVGLSAGMGLSPDYRPTDLSALGSCVPTPPVAHDGALCVGQGSNAPITLRASDDGLPNPPGALTCVLTSLPGHGTLNDPLGGPISVVPYSLIGYGNRVDYVPEPSYVGPDSFAFYVQDGGVPPEGGDSNPATISLTVQPLPELIYRFPLDSDPGWATTGQWAWGRPIGGGSHARDPHLGYTGQYVYGYNLEGDYANHMQTPEYLTTGALDCSSLSGVQLRFWRWLGVEALDQAGVEVSNDGQTWVPVWANVSTHDESEWTPHGYDISAIADGQSTVYIRWSMGPTNASITYPGWNIDDVEIWGIVSAPVPGDLDGDGNIDIEDFVILAGCLVGPTVPPAFGCENADLDQDMDVDMADFGVFQLYFGRDR